jgi:peptidoglycan/LPS O-acetylase OafA/YrhL
LDLGTAATFWTAPIILEFLAGVLIGTVAKAGLALPRWAGWLIVVAGAYLLLTSRPSEDHRLLVWGLPSAMLVCGLVLGRIEPVFGRHTIKALGDASYALYLFHPLCIRAAILALSFLGVDVGALSWPLLFVSVGFAVAVSVVVNRLVERPTTQWLRQSYSYRSAQASTQPPR